MNSKNYKLSYTNYENKENDRIIQKASYYAILNILLKKELITKEEYDKIKCTIS